MEHQNSPPGESTPRARKFLLWIIYIMLGVLGLLLIMKITGLSPFTHSSDTTVLEKPGRRSAGDKGQTSLNRQGKEDLIRLNNLALHYSGEKMLEGDEQTRLEQLLGITPDALRYCRLIGARRYGSTVGLSSEKWLEILQAGLPQYQQLGKLLEDIILKPAERIQASDIEKMLADEKRADRFFEGLRELRDIPPALSRDYAAKNRYQLSDWAMFAYEYN